MAGYVGREKSPKQYVSDMSSKTQENICAGIRAVNR